VTAVTHLFLPIRGLRGAEYPPPGPNRYSRTPGADRVYREQSGVDRLTPASQVLNQQGIGRHGWELLGDGSEAADLEQQFSQIGAKVRCQGGVQGTAA
jgi:hypothetical protein